MRKTVLLLSLLLVLPALVRAADFETAAAGAQHLDALEPFLTRFIGRCTDVYERQKCEANLAAARKAVVGHAFVVRVPDAAALVQPQRGGAGYTLLLTPFIDGGGLALTNGAPTRQDPAGRPLIGVVPIPAAVPAGMMEMEFESPFRTGAIELEIVFRPEKIWRLPRRGEKGDYEGVAARFVAVRVIDSRSGNAIAARVL